MAATSAGILLWRHTGASIEVLIAHPGGPFWARKDEGAWSIPKGEYDPAAEDPQAAAKREFEEELGCVAPVGPYIELGDTRLKSGKVILAWAVEGDFDPADLVSNTFEVEWPPRSGSRQSFPEIDRVEWAGLTRATEALHPAQVVFLHRLSDVLADGTSTTGTSKT